MLFILSCFYSCDNDNKWYRLKTPDIRSLTNLVFVRWYGCKWGLYPHGRLLDLTHVLFMEKLLTLTLSCIFFEPWTNRNTFWFGYEFFFKTPLIALSINDARTFVMHEKLFLELELAICANIWRYSSIQRLIFYALH